MKLTKLSKQQLALITKASKLIIDPKSPVAILECAYVHNGDIRYSDLHHDLTILGVGIEGEFLINNKELLQTLSLMPEFGVQVEHVESKPDRQEWQNGVLVDKPAEYIDRISFYSPDKTEELKYTGEDTENFVYIPGNHLTFEFMDELQGSVLEQVGNAARFVSKDQLRPAMMHVALMQGYVTGTDAHLLFWEPTAFDQIYNVLIPEKTRRVLELFHSDDDLIGVSLAIDWPKPEDKRDDKRWPQLFGPNETPYEYLERLRENWRKNEHYTPEEIERMAANFCRQAIRYENSKFKLTTWHANEKYPDIFAVIPSENPVKLTVSKKELEPVLKKALLMANLTTHQGVFTLVGPEGEKPGLHIHSEDIDFAKEYNKHITNVKVVIPDAAEFMVGFNMEFMWKWWPLVGEEFTFNMSTPNRACIINNNLLMMPVMVKDYM